MSQEVSPFTGFVEFAPSFQQREKIQHVLFDFDGTLSLVREGWPHVCGNAAKKVGRHTGRSGADAFG
ncbi:MAG: hypothetical protein ACPHRA_06040 [Limisphaerales bacterium]